MADQKKDEEQEKGFVVKDKRFSAKKEEGDVRPREEARKEEPWMLLDARWAWDLARQARDTGQRYAGKDWRERHLAAEDGPLFAFIEKVRTQLPATPTRVLVAADAHYFRSRGAYHLYPHNVYFDPYANTFPPGARLRPGDYVVVYQRRGMQFDPAAKRLRWDGGAPVAADMLLAEGGGALFRIR